MKRIHSKENLLQVGLDLVWSRGFNGTGVEAILKEAKIPKGSFYNFFSSKEEFSLAVIDKFVAARGDVLFPILNDATAPPIARVKKSFETIIAAFEEIGCSKGCLLGNLGQEMSDQSEKVRQRLEESLRLWEKRVSDTLAQAQKENEISAEIDVEMLAETMIASFQGALLRSKIKKSSEPLRHFIHLYFNIFLAQR
ncbi:MAG: transcriptional regulator [Solidesulfovibrio magneticus str. Maddingley MBC34]|uniref:Transcriptional regulator n=1 Tax=Solidesulfovibrio magneticus str. Maddingley MBC34 TaxID=1206767 RepID=K6H9D8_9BACT|nr:MAG: transcriptional regulator [Solidesulfovibrio magneticus str. Maddingley MBC34]